MRTRLASVATAILLATAALAGTAGTALMATTTVVFGGGDNGQVLCEYTYDSVSHVMQSLIAINNDSIPHIISASALDPTTFAPVAAGSVTLAANTSQTWNIAPLNLALVQSTGKDGTLFWHPAYAMSCATN